MESKNVQSENTLAELDFSSFKRRVKLTYRIDLDAYKRPQMERRIRANMIKCGANTFTQYFSMMQSNKELADEFIDRVTINVSELFRNADQFDVLKTNVLPELLNKFGDLSIWSAGCSFGAEAYTIAILLDELSPNGKHTILGTDIDDRMLERAQKGIYFSHEIRSVSKQRLQKNFDPLPDGSYQIKQPLKRNVSFKRHDMLKDRFSLGFELIVCRNVVIYFTDETKTNLYKRFYDSLEYGGSLFVGGTERIIDYKEIGFENRIPFFYRKPDKN